MVRSDAWSEHLSAGLALAAALIVRLWLAARNAGLTMDSPLYVGMADSLAHGTRAPGPAHHGYPLLVTLAQWFVPGREWPGRTVSLAAGIALVLVVYLLARRTLPSRMASLAAWLVGLHPLVAVYSGTVMTESAFLAIAYAGLWLIEQRRFAAGGAVLGFSYLVRPEALVLAPAAALLGRGGRRGGARVMLAFLAVLVPYAGYLRWERGSWMLTPKTVLVRPSFESPREAEWRVGDAARPVQERPLGFAARIRWAAPSIARHFPASLGRHLARLLEAWPWPLLLMSVLGLASWRRAVASPLLLPFALPLLAVPFDARFAQLPLPALAVFAALGAATLAARLGARAPRPQALAGAIALATLASVWAGPLGRQARTFDDGPMEQMREAGEWLRLHGRADALVMDRKAFVPFFAGMRHIQLPDDDYEALLGFARRAGVDYIVVEEYLVPTLRPQLLPLVQDREARLREKRVRQAFVTGIVPMTGVAVFEVVRDSSVAGAGRPETSRAPAPRR